MGQKQMLRIHPNHSFELLLLGAKWSLKGNADTGKNCVEVLEEDGAG
ncbi:MAG: hypothetical protein OEM64_04980 [Gammaproteobacteria bacterium]|nr:hypothetical protein [Gammaproteobacteria bacterium]MDH3415647.1 hypothetical protein [Gammaproteobacteria bacterium]